MERFIGVDTIKKFFDVEIIRVNLEVKRIIIRANGSKNDILL